jgi:hypothetical protein
MVFIAIGKILLLSNLAATLFLTGLVWELQVVQFPLMLRAGGLDFPNYVKQQRIRNTLLMAPVMLIELITGLSLLLDPNLPHSDVFHAALLIVVIWIVTFASIVPLHSKLARGYSEATVRTVIRVNWIRTVCWSLRSPILLWIALLRFR